MKKVLLCILLLCTYTAAISQNPILLKDVYPGVTGSGIQQIVKTSNYIFFNADDDADTERSLLRSDGTPTGNLKHDLSYTAYSNFTKDYSFNSAAIDNWGVVGTATPNGWGGPDMPLTYDANSNTWSAVVSLSNGEIKFRNNNDWAVNYGDNGADGSLDAGGSNIIVTAGTYLITLDFTTLNYSILSPSVNLPDPNFEQALIDLGFDKDGVVNASILRSDAEAITQLDVTGKNISSLQGIEAFINLSRLYCQNNQIQVLNISKNIALTVLECGGNQLTELNVTKNLLLRTLGFGYNNISAIDVSKNLNLEVFWCNNNNIKSQNLNLNSALTVVGLSNNPLTFVSLKNGNNIKIVYFEAYNTPTLACINSDAVVSVSMTNSGKTFSENCSVTSLAGRWIIAPETRALKVGPTPGSDLWWYLNKFGNDIAARACYMDDKYVFGKDGSFRNVLGSETFLEPWQGVNPEQCGTPVAPHNGANATYVYDQNTGKITLNGKGAYLGLPKVANGYELPNGPVPNSITYDVVFSENGNVMTLSIDLGGGFWTYKLIKESTFKAYYVNDNLPTGDLFTSATGNNANAGTKAAPFSTLTYALSQSGEGDTIYVDAGTYAEQVTIDKGITIIGAGQNLTSITNPGSPLTPPPGPFAEYALIQTTQNIGDVHISNLQATNTPANNGHSILLQTGGSVKNCRIIDGSLGVYVRVESATTNVVVENNFIQSSVFAVACQGSGVTATILNNTLNLFNPGFSVGIWVGVDFGPIAKLTATGNSINNYVYRGIVGNSNNTVLTENSILGTGQYAIENTANPAVATCNWYGSSDQYVVASKMSGAVNFSPWLVNGADNDPASIGFQPVPGSCAGRQLFYVNDNSLTGDIYTTAVGNNANNGSFSAPLATITAALAKSQAGDIILVDAGNYTEQVNIHKAITIIGAGRTLTIINGPAAPIAELPDWGEKGIIQSIAGIGDVIIENLLIDGTNSDEQHSIMIQGGGRVSNCEMRNANNGFFFRHISTQPRTAIGNNNYIHNISFVGILFAGNGLTAEAYNNVIDLNGALSGMGFISGWGGDGNVASLTASNNSIINFNGFGMMIGSIQSAQVHNNSITKIAGNNNYLINVHSVNIDATCNWFGTTDAALIVPFMSGAITYSPWLTNGTDNDAAFGFQPQPNVCNGRQNKFYVNDGSQIGDVFTTALGNNANSGIPSAPLATLQEAINRAQNGDEIYVDAGTYVENVIVNKSVTLLGAKYGQHPGSSLDRLNETIIIPAVSNVVLTGGSVIRIAASNVTVDGLLIDGNNPNLTSGTLVNGVDVNAATGIFNDDNIVSNLTVKNTIVKNTGTYGIGLFRTFGNQTGPAVSGNLFTQNRVDNIGFRGIVFAYNAFGDITNNYISRCGGSGTWFSQQRVANINNAPSYVTGNTIVNCNLGMQSSSVLTPASQIYYLNNELSNNTTSNFAGISLIGIGNASGFVAANNKISGFTRGVTINASNATVPILINNNSITNFTNFAIEVLSSNPVNATCNWYGSAAVQDFYAKLSLAADLEILPWLTNGTDNDVATGFQPVPDACDGYPTLITLNSSTNVTCNGAANGSIDITTSYGKAPFTYTWTKEGDANFVSNSEDLTSLAPGTYTLSILDGNGSNIYITDPEADGPGVITVVITEPDVLTASADGDNNICFNGTIGSASVTPAGGTAPYTYLWSNGGTTNEITNLAAGDYNVTVTDANGCTTTTSYQVTQPAQLTASITNSSTACSNIATVNASGGTPGILPTYTYLWSNGATSATISGVPVGLYDVTVTDANGCTATASVTLTVSEAFNPSASVTNITCFGANDGIITATNVNGTAPFMFSKDGGISFVNGSLPFSFTNLAPGTYNIAVKDANGCVGFVEKTITQPTPINVTNTVQSTCYGESTGAVNVTVSGGTPAYSYSWTKEGGGFSSSQLNISGLSEGNYTLTVTDKNNCTYSIEVNVPTNPEILVNETINHVTCRGAANGSITVNASGGTNSPDPAFSYLWNTGATTTTISNLAPGNYSVRITDNGSGCFVNKSYTITQPALVLSLATAKTNATGCNSLGTITATGSGGTAPYTYSVNGEAMIGNSIGGLSGGDYNITVTDANGCATSKLVTITDNGSDEYEGNNSKNQAKAIVVGTTINARLALSNDAADWFTFTAPGSTTGLYSIKITHPTAAYTVAVFASGKNTTALVPVSVISGSESHYQLTAGATYFVSITTTTLSYICYNFSVSALEPIESAANRTETKIAATPMVDILKAFTYPNPHNGNFTLSIESPEEGVATVELYTVNGQKLSERKANVVKGKGNTVKYNNMKYAILFYKVRIGKHVVTGKIISPN